MAQTLTDHVALITGSTTGLGFGIAKVLGQAGAKVIMNYYNDEERADRAFSEFKSLGCDGVLVRGNAIDESSVQEIVNTGESKFGPIDITFINIGAYNFYPIMPKKDHSIYHTNPEEALSIARDLKSKKVIGMHWGTVILSLEPIMEPPVRFKNNAKKYGFEKEDAIIFKIGDFKSFDEILDN